MLTHTFTFSKTELEEYIDDCKAVIVQALVNDNLLDETVAENWCLNTTVIIRRQSRFQSFVNRLLRNDNKGYSYLLVVKSIPSVT